MSQALLILIGPPGSGKTHFASQFAAKHSFAHVNNDRVRQELIAEPQYSPEERIRVYSRMHELVEQQLSQGRSVILDGNLITNETRAVAMRMHRAGSHITGLFICFDTPTEVAIDRAANRKETADGFNSTMPRHLAERMHESFEEIDPSLPHITLDGHGAYESQELVVLNALNTTSNAHQD